LPHGAPFRLNWQEASGALADLGTLLPLTLGAIAVAGLAPMPVLLGFAAFYVATALVYRLPVPVQPMKAVGALLLVAEVSPAALAAGGAMIGAVLLVLGATGLIDRLGRLVPQSVLAGLQLGLGIALAMIALRLMAGTPLVALALLALLGGLAWKTRLPAALVTLAVALALGAVLGLPGLAPAAPAAPWTLPGLPGLADMRTALTGLALPQLALTLTNAILLTALVTGDYFGPRAAHVTPRRLALSTGLANLVLTPLGALPMCHGTGGVAAHHRFGARSGTAPLLLGVALVALALAPGGAGLALLAAVPAAALGALLFVAAAELGASRRLVDCRPSCRPVIAVAAAATVLLDPAWGLVLGLVAEAARVAVLRRLFTRKA